jgi:hypothetical protein
MHDFQVYCALNIISFFALDYDMSCDMSRDISRDMSHDMSRDMSRHEAHTHSYFAQFCVALVLPQLRNFKCISRILGNHGHKDGGKNLSLFCGLCLITTLHSSQVVRE